MFFVSFFFLSPSRVGVSANHRIAASEELFLSYFPRHVALTWLWLDLICESESSNFLLGLSFVHVGCCPSMIWYGINTGRCCLWISVREVSTQVQVLPLPSSRSFVPFHCFIYSYVYIDILPLNVYIHCVSTFHLSFRTILFTKWQPKQQPPQKPERIFSPLSMTRLPLGNRHYPIWQILGIGVSRKSGCCLRR